MFSLMTLSHEDKLVCMKCKFTVKDKLEWTRPAYNFMYYQHFFPTDTEENHLSQNSQYLH